MCQLKKQIKNVNTVKRTWIMSVGQRDVTIFTVQLVTGIPMNRKLRWNLLAKTTSNHNLRSLKPCHKFGCNNLSRSKYCKEHTYIDKEQKKKFDKDYDKRVRSKRDNIFRKFYHSKEWRQTRARALQRDNYLCSRCKVRVADTVHHIISTRTDWSKRLDINNLKSIYSSCHSKHKH